MQFPSFFKKKSKHTKIPSCIIMVISHVSSAVLETLHPLHRPLPLTNISGSSSRTRHKRGMRHILCQWDLQLSAESTEMLRFRNPGFNSKVWRKVCSIGYRPFCTVSPPLVPVTSMCPLICPSAPISFSLCPRHIM